MRITNQDLFDIHVDFDERKLVTGAPEEYTWRAEDDERVSEWLKQTVEADSLEDAYATAPDLPEFLVKAPALLSTADAAEVLGISERRVRALCAAGRMGRQVGTTWVITPEDIEANKVRKPGRPAKSE